MAGEYQRGAKLSRWADQLENPSKALEAIGLIVVKQSQKAFDDQRLGDNAWDARRVPNLFGIIKDFADGKKEPPKRRFDARPALRDTGRLYSSIAHKILNADTVQVGSNLPYASVQNFGGDVESETITKDVQDALAKFIGRRQGEVAKYPVTYGSMRSMFGWLLSPRWTGKKLKARVPARPFIGLTQETVEDIAVSIGREVFEVV